MSLYQARGKDCPSRKGAQPTAHLNTALQTLLEVVAVNARVLKDRHHSIRE